MEELKNNNNPFMLVSCTVSSSSRPGCRFYVLPLCEGGFGGALLASNSVKSVHVSVTPT